MFEATLYLACCLFYLLLSVFVLSSRPDGRQGREFYERHAVESRNRRTQRLCVFVNVCVHVCVRTGMKRKQWRDEWKTRLNIITVISINPQQCWISVLKHTQLHTKTSVERQINYDPHLVESVYTYECMSLNSM